MHTIINWMKEFLILYLILTIIMQLAAAEQYKKYLRFLSGIILLVMLMNPVLRLTGKGGDEIARSYERFWEQMENFSKEAGSLKLQQNGYELQLYEDAVAANLTAQAQEQGILISQMQVTLTDDYKLQSVTVWLDAVYRQQHPSADKQMITFLKETCDLNETQIFIY